jgi:hypothetical protein
MTATWQVVHDTYSSMSGITEGEPTARDDAVATLQEALGISK